MLCYVMLEMHIKLHKKIDKDTRSLVGHCEERGLLLDVLVNWDQSEQVKR